MITMESEEGYAPLSKKEELMLWILSNTPKPMVMKVIKTLSFFIKK